MFYLNAREEDLRSVFVAYAGKEDLMIDLHISNGDAIDFGDLARDVDSPIGKGLSTQD